MATESLIFPSKKWVGNSVVSSEELYPPPLGIRSGSFGAVGATTGIFFTGSPDLLRRKNERAERREEGLVLEVDERGRGRGGTLSSCSGC